MSEYSNWYEISEEKLWGRSWIIAKQQALIMFWDDNHKIALVGKIGVRGRLHADL